MLNFFISGEYLMSNVTVVIPNYNGREFLSECFDSLKAQNVDLKVVVVDNGSDDGSADYIKKYYPEFDLTVNGENKGFAAAVNQGITSTNTDYVFLMNNDVVLEENCIENLQKCIEKDSKIFAVSSKMIQYGDRGKIDDAGDEYTLLGWTKKVGNGKSTDLYSEEREIFSACAGASLYRRSVFDEIGFFDENFFAYMEDVDISYRARIHGYKCVYCPDAHVYHVGSATSGSKYNSFKIRLAARNNVYVAYKNMPLPQLAVNMIFLVPGFLIKYLFFLRINHGSDYITGLREGLNSLDRVDKKGYDGKKLSNYLSIEWYLLKNTFKSIYI